MNRKILFFKNDFVAKENQFFKFVGLKQFAPKDFLIIDLRNAITKGISGVSFYRLLENAEGVDYLYRNQNKEYLALCRRFCDYAKKFDALVMFDYNFIHPNILMSDLKKLTKIFSFVDDPYSTYSRGLNYSQFFDGSIYISPTYLDQISMRKFLLSSNNKNIYWMPLVKPDLKKIEFQELIERKKNYLFYVGAPTYKKYDLLRSSYKVCKEKGIDFKLYGNWGIFGLQGFYAPLFKESIFLKRVKKIKTKDYSELHLNGLAGLNMHCSGFDSESGNMRTYELASHACISISFQKKENEKIFPSETGIYLNHPEELGPVWEEVSKSSNKFKEIVRERYEFFWNNYSPELLYERLFDWIMSLKK